MAEFGARWYRVKTDSGRIVSAGLIPLTLAPFAAGSLNPTTDAILCSLLLIHSHIGFE
jgi:succinate dehydrogenase (ubiquinone) membrane anchor subunit